ncbi:MAG: tetratricopeptide repeat protein [Candidatus Odinarchaeota archaeon]|nr:tetratricopeptide repeat protein [Candidatus Odinarchaeota archaeon]
MAFKQIIESAMKNIQQGNLKSAQYDMKTAKGMEPNNPLVWHVDGILQARLNNFEAAISSFNKSFQLGAKENFENCFYLGYAYMRLEKYEEALPYLEKAIGFNDSVSLAYFSKAWCLAHLKRTDEAIVAAKKCLELNPNDNDAKQLLSALQS